MGVTLGAILTLGFSQETAAQAMVLSSGYAVGLGLPFLTLAFFLGRALSIVKKMGRQVRTFQRISGVFLIIVGLMMITDQITLIAIWAQRNGLYLGFTLWGSERPDLPGGRRRWCTLLSQSVCASTRSSVFRLPERRDLASFGLTRTRLRIKSESIWPVGRPRSRGTFPAASD